MQDRTGKAYKSPNFKGVFKRKSEEKWCVQIQDEVGKLWSGHHDSKTEAVLVYAAAEILFGQYAYQNFADDYIKRARHIDEKYIERRKKQTLSKKN